MSGLFKYANDACTRAKNMHADSTLLEFLQDGGDLLRDVYHATGCSGDAASTVYAVADKCDGLKCTIEGMVCPKEAPGSKGKQWCCTGGTWVEGDCATSIPLPATECPGFDCTIEGQVCPLGAPGAATSSFCCVNKKWTSGPCPAKTVQPFFDLDAKMSRYFANASGLCTQESLRAQCCGSAGCIPERCKKLTGAPPLPRCSVTAETCNLMTEWVHVPQGGAISTAGNNETICADIGRGASGVLDPSDLAKAAVMPQDIPDLQVPYPSALPRQLVDAAPKSHRCLPLNKSNVPQVCTLWNTAQFYIAPATECPGFDCDIEGQFCPLGSPGASSSPFCCTDGRWQAGDDCKPPDLVDGNVYKNCTDLFRFVDGEPQGVASRPGVGTQLPALHLTDEIAAAQDPESVVGQCLRYGLSYAESDFVASCNGVPNKGNFRVLVDDPVPTGQLTDADAVSVVTSNEMTSMSAWHAAGCFSESGRKATQSGRTSVQDLLGAFSSVCLDAQQGQASAEIACCGRVGCGAVLGCPTVSMLELPVQLCSDGRVAHRSGSGYVCYTYDVVAGVACKDRCALADSFQECQDVVAFDVGGDGCAIVPSAACQEVKRWDDTETFPCLNGVDVLGNACQGAPFANNTCKVRQQQAAAPSPCPRFGKVDVLHTPWNFEQLPGSCQSNVFGNTGIQPAITTDTWAQCEHAADLQGADEFSYDEATGRCVVNTGSTPCETVQDVVSAVEEMNHYGSAREGQGTGTDLRAWIGVAGAKKVFAIDATSPKKDKTSLQLSEERNFLCVPKDKCRMRDVHGRCVSTTGPYMMEECLDAPDGYCVAGCTCEKTSARGQYANCCACNNDDDDTCDYNPYQVKAGSVDAFLDDDRTICSMRTREDCETDDKCKLISTLDDVVTDYKVDAQNGIHADNPCKLTETSSSNDCNDATAEYLGDSLDGSTTVTQRQKEFDENYHLTQESLLGQDYASTFYRTWLTHAWNRERYMGAAARYDQFEGDMPFYASAILSGNGGASWRDVPNYDQRWMPGAAGIAPESCGQATGSHETAMGDIETETLTNDAANAIRCRPLRAYLDRQHNTTMWSPLRAWLLGAWDKYLDDVPQYLNVAPRKDRIKPDVQDRIVAFRGRLPLESRGAELNQTVMVDRANAANDCLQKCIDLGGECSAVSLQSALLADDNEPLDFVRTGGGLGAQGSSYFRPQACPANTQPHLSSFQYMVPKYCIQSIQDFMEKEAIPNSILYRLVHKEINLQRKGGRKNQESFGIMGLPDSEDVYDNDATGDPVTLTDFADPKNKDGDSESVAIYGNSQMIGMMGSVGTTCRKHTTGPLWYLNGIHGLTTVGNAKCHLKIGMHHCDKCWDSSQDNFDSTNGRTKTFTSPPQLKCKLWKRAPLSSLGPDPEGDIITAFDGDGQMGVKKTINLNEHNDDVPSITKCPTGYGEPNDLYGLKGVCCRGTVENGLCQVQGENILPLASECTGFTCTDDEEGQFCPNGTPGASDGKSYCCINRQWTEDDSCRSKSIMAAVEDERIVLVNPRAYAKARLQRPTPVRFRYTTIYLPEEDFFQSTVGAETATRYRRKKKPPVHDVKKSRVTAPGGVGVKPVTDDDQVTPVEPNAALDDAVKMTKAALGEMGVKDEDYWVGRDTACNFRQGDRPVFTSVKCPADKPLTCALPWTVAAQNVVNKVANKDNPTDYRVNGTDTTKCQPLVAVCLQAEMRYIGVIGSSLCAELARVLEIVEGGEVGSTSVQSVDLGPPPHVAGGTFSWPVQWLQQQQANTSSSNAFRTRRAEPRPTSNLGACPDRKPCGTPPCPTGFGLSWAPSGTPYCTRVGAGSRGYQQVTRDVPKSLHGGKQAFGGFVARPGAVSGTGPALYSGAAACDDNGCGGDIMSACRFDHQSDRNFPSCQARAAQACCDADVNLTQALMPSVELDLFQPPNNLQPPHVDQPNVTCEARLGLACGNAEFASRTVHDTTCSCETDACEAAIRPQTRVATMRSLDAAAVVVSQGQNCGARVEWATQYASFGPGSARCNGVDDIFAGGGPLGADGHQRCGCRRPTPSDARWPRMCASPSGCAVHGVFEIAGTGATCANDLEISVPPGGLGQFGGDVDNACAHQCLHHGAACWAFDATKSVTCRLHVEKPSSSQTCVGTPQYRRILPTWSVVVPQHGVPHKPLQTPLTVENAAKCAEQCAVTTGCRAWAFADNNKCHLAASVRQYRLNPRTNSSEIKFDNTSNKINALIDARLQRVFATINTTELASMNSTQGLQVIQAADEALVPTNESVFNISNTGINMTADTDFNPNITMFAPCDRVLGTLQDARTLSDCELACDDGATLGCVGFEVNNDGSCTMCAGGGGMYGAVAQEANHATVGDFHGISSGASAVAHRSLDDCQAACNATDRTGRACGHCVGVFSVSDADTPRYVQIGKSSTVSNTLRRRVYPWTQQQQALTKWDARCCSQAPCGQSRAPGDFPMSACPILPDNADQAGPNAMFDLDPQRMSCFTTCRAKFANPPACNECAQANFDPETNCTQCLPQFALASDGACSLCKDPRRDIAGTPPCERCMPGFRVSEGGVCQEWTCDAKLDFGASAHAVTEVTDVVLNLQTGKRMATGAFVGVAQGRVPASLRSTLVRHRGNVYLLGNGARFLVETDAINPSIGAIQDVLDVGSDWLDSLPMADSSNFQQPLNRSVLMRPGANGILGHHRCGASKIDVVTKSPASNNAQATTKDACTSITGGKTLCTLPTNDLALSSPVACSQACIDDLTCVSFVHQASSQNTYTQESVGGEPQFDVSTQATCELYTVQQAGDADRPRNIMVEDGRCSGAGLRVPGEGLVSYVPNAEQPQVAPIESELQFRIVSAVDLLGEKAGCWMLTRWHRHRVIRVDKENVTAQDACQGNDTVTVEYLEHHAPMQGDDLRGDAVVGFMPRARTAYDFVSGGTEMPNSTASVPECVRLCLHGFATQWDAQTGQCLCFADEDAARVSVNVPTTSANVVITGRRPMGGRVLGPGPVPPACNVSGADTGAGDAGACDEDTSDSDGFVLGPAPSGCRPLQCSTGAEIGFGNNTNADIVQLNRHPVIRPVLHARLAFGEMDVPIANGTTLDGAACCARCSSTQTAPGANSYRFDRATGTCQCFDSRARVCAASLEMVVAGRCRFCLKDKVPDCILGSKQDCEQETKTADLNKCSPNSTAVTFAGAGISQGCTPDLLAQKASPTLGCDRAAGCVLAKSGAILDDYFCRPASRINTDTHEWDKPPRAVQLDTAATQVPDLAALCLAHGYDNGTCAADRITDNAVCDCALDAGGNVTTACNTTTCEAPGTTKAVWCCDALNGQTPCGPAATTSAVVADITTIFKPHDSRTAIAQLKHDNVCSATAGLAQTFSLVRCAPNQCMSMGSLVQNALFVVSSQNPQLLERVPDDDCAACDLCNFPTQYRSANDVRQLTLATGISKVDARCPAHMPHPVATQCLPGNNPVTEQCRPGADPAAATNACALTTWGGPPMCCMQGETCLDEEGNDMKLATCEVLPQLECANLRDPCAYEPELPNTACQALASVVLRDVADIGACQKQCDAGQAPPCLLYEYEASTQLCLLGKADSVGMRACASDSSTHQPATGVTLVIKVAPPSAVCDSANLRHFSQPTHVAKFETTTTQPIILSSVAQEHSQLYATPSSTKVKRLYGTFARSYNFARTLQSWLVPYNTLCNTNGTNCPGTMASAQGHLVAHPGFDAGPGESESMVFQSTTGTVADSDNAAVVASAAVMTRPGNAGSDACITQAELSVQDTATLGAVSQRFENSSGRGWVDGVDAVTPGNTNMTQFQCLQKCVSRVPTCVAFQHDSLDPLQTAACQLYVGRRLAIENIVNIGQAPGSTVYVTSGIQTCTSPEQCVHVSKAQSDAELSQQSQTFEDALKRCQQETFDSETGRPKLMGRATYVNVVQCPKDGPKPTPAHLRLHDHEAGVVCWSDKVAAPGKRSQSSNRANFYPFNAPEAPEPEDQEDAPPALPPLDFTIDNGTFPQIDRLVETFAGCNFHQFTNQSAIVNESPGPSFVDLEDVLDCEAQSRQNSKEQCEADDACKFTESGCLYTCTENACANTLLCRGYEKRADGTTHCLFLRAGTEEGTMQPPSALQPCLVTGLHKILKPDAGTNTSLKTDCCTGVAV